MNSPQIRRVVLLGAGNVSTHLADQLKQSYVALVQIWSRTERSARTLAQRSHSPYCTDLADLQRDADAYILAVPDDAFPDILPFLHLDPDRLLIHTSGSTPLSALAPYTKRAGVFYPVQAFLPEHPVDFSKLPVCIEADQPSDLESIRDFARLFTCKIYEIDSEKRKVVHLAAIFAGNFTNFLYHVSDELLQKMDLPFDLVRPIIEETALRVQTHNPSGLQTGPAHRRDMKIISDHLEWLSSMRKYQELYALIAQCILNNDKQALQQ